MNIESVTAMKPPITSAETSLAARESRAAAPVAEAGPSSARQPSEDQLKVAVQSVQEYIKPFNNNLEFSLDKDIDRMVIKVVDSTTKDVIRQIPSEEMIAIAKALDSIKGLFIKQTA